LSAAAIERLAGVALPSVGAALTAFQERRKDVFAPSRLPTAVRIDVVLARPRTGAARRQGRSSAASAA
jgi:hypothetical protein